MGNKINHQAQMLLDKIQNRTAIVGVIGLGYVGLPLAVEKAKAGYQVIGFDVNQKRVDMVNQGHNYIGDIMPEELTQMIADGKLTATTDYHMMAQVDAVAICVPVSYTHLTLPTIYSV